MIYIHYISKYLYVIHIYFPSAYPFSTAIKRVHYSLAKYLVLEHAKCPFCIDTSLLEQEARGISGAVS